LLNVQNKLYDENCVNINRTCFDSGLIKGEIY
jgi:hypothetical protein